MGVASLSAFGGKYVLAEASLGCDRCPELGGVRSRRFKCTAHSSLRRRIHCQVIGPDSRKQSTHYRTIRKSIRGMSYVRCIEFVRFLEGPLLEVYGHNDPSITEETRVSHNGSINKEWIIGIQGVFLSRITSMFLRYILPLK